MRWGRWQSWSPDRSSSRRSRGSYRFVHDTLREIALGRIARAREQSLHGAAAAVLEERQDGSADAGRTYAALAAHYGAAGQHVKCLHYQERAAERALRAARRTRRAVWSAARSISSPPRRPTPPA